MAPIIKHSRSERTYCKQCGNPAKEGKDVCIEHLNKSPYVAELLKKIKEHEKETACIKKHGVEGVSLTGWHVTEILTELKLHGPKTVHGLARATQFDPEIVEACLAKLEPAGKIETSTSRRGRLTADVKK